MGQNLCSSTSEVLHDDIRPKYLQFQFGEDYKQGKVEHQEILKCKSFFNLEIVLQESAEKLKASKLMYKDPSMPTDKLILKSISKQNNQKKQIEAVFMKPYRFLKGAEKGKSYKVFPAQDSHSDDIVVMDEVLQYFGVFLCFLARHPKIVSEMILTDSNTFGIFAVRMYIYGKQEIIYLDDYILCVCQVPLFTQPIKSVYLWPCIIEKAWLKVTGFTQKVIEKATPEQVFQSFLNYPSKRFHLEQLDEPAARSYLQKYLYQTQKDYGYILTTKKTPKIHIGISGKKYLYLMGSFLYEQKRLFYIRNPCGQFNFRGQFDDISEHLKTKIKETFNIASIEEGNFILQESQFLEQISQFSIYYYSPQLKPTSIAVQLQNNCEIMIQTELKCPSLVSFCFRQQSSRKSDNRFSPITYQIFNVDTGELVSDQENMEGCFGLHNAYLFNEVIKKLPQSKYLIRLKKKDKKQHYFGIQSILIACSLNELKFDMKNQQQCNLLNKKVTQIFKESLKKQGKRHLAKGILNKSTAKKGALTPIDHVVFIAGDLICVYIEYVSIKQEEYKVEISFPELKNLQLIYPEMNLRQTSVLPNALSPSNKQEVIVFEKIDLTAETELGYFELQAF